MSSLNPQYAIAARRHFDCATLLKDGQQLGDADHLAGFAAECALKAIMQDHLGWTLNARNRLQHNSDPTQNYSHINALWGQVANTAHGRTAARFLSLISGPNPFASWDVSDRYGDCAHITSAIAQEHIDAAGQVLTAHAQAQLDGGLA